MSRGRTIAIRAERAALARGAVLYPERDYWKPRTRGDCVDMERPCPYVSCRYHLYLDVNGDNGTVKLNFPDRDVHELAESCALDVAERGASHERVGELLNLTKSRIQQIEAAAIEGVREELRSAV